MPGVLAEHDVGRAELLEDAQRHVAQVPDRRRADRERHAYLGDRLERDEPGADHAGHRPELGDREPHPLAGRRERLAQHHLAHRPEQQLACRDAEAAADHDHVGIEEVDERPDRRAEVAADLLERRMPLLDQVARRGLRAEQLARKAVRGVPEQYDSTWPRPVQAPWQGSPSSTITMCPTSAQPR